MSQKWFNNIDLQQNELQNGVIQNLAGDPSSGKAGQIYYNTSDKGYRYHNGAAWVSITAEAVKSIIAGNGLTSSGTDTVTISLGTPSASGSGSNTYGSNGVTTNSHTHQIKLPDATETEKGVVQLATQDEINTGTNTTKVITPATLGKGKASGVASLDANSKIITSQLPDYLLGQVMYGGNASTVATTTIVSPSDSLKTKKNITATSISIVNSATSTTANTYGYKDMEGVYFICQASGTFAGVSFETGDWIISTGAKWEKIDNTDAVKSVNGQTGAVNITRVNEAGTADKVANSFQLLGNDLDGNVVDKKYDGSARSGILFPENLFMVSNDNITGGVNVALKPTGVTEGTYNNITVDGFGRVTAGSNVSYSKKQVHTFSGNGNKTSFEIAHTLGSDVTVQVYLTGQTVGSRTVDELIMVDTYTVNNIVILVFATAPTSSQSFKVIVIG